jgi:hypothetical protein
MQSGSRSKKTASSGRSWASVAKTSSENAKQDCLDGVISRDEFLAGRVISLMKGLPKPKAMAGLRTEANALVSPNLQSAAPPPGLEDDASSAKLASLSMAEKEPFADVPLAEPQTYKALLRDLPEAMLKECMLRAMLEQAKLRDIVDLAFRPNGKALVTFSSYESLHCCIAHFHGRQWANSTVPVTAIYVRTVKRNDAPPMQEAKPMSADAPVFVPTACTFSVDAPVFVPGADKFQEQRDRSCSSASTDVGLLSGASNDGESENERHEAVKVPIACT